MTSRCASGRRGTIVFDMDGVLVDVSQSYRETIRETVHHYTKQWIEHEAIQDYKNQGGWNNDWALSQRIIEDLGQEVPYEEVVRTFQLYFFGTPLREGLILRERWLPSDGLLDRLKRKYRLAIFTGRLRAEAGVTLNRFVPDLEWDLIVGDDDVSNSKPAPEGLLKIMAAYPEEQLWYVGDTVDDARSAAGALVPFIGIAAKHNPRYEELVELLKAKGAIAVFENVNELETIL
jgi:HAD superfamily hydrolase (TIGR01548 family)